MGGRIRGAAGVVLLATTGLVAVFLVGMRRKYPPVVDTVRRLARDVGNPRLLRFAGGPGAIASVVHHVGRTSGRQYRTPVTAVPTGDGFVIALPYGPNTDWLKNVLASGSAELVHDGQTFAVDRPEVITSSEAAQHFSSWQRRVLGTFGVTECLYLRRSDPDATGG